MSSGGVRAAGTDGSDFEHRQKIAAHYAESVLAKSRLKTLIILHLSLLFVLFVKVFDYCLRMVGLDQDWFTDLELPSPNVWEYLYVLSLIPIALTWLSMPRNNDTQMIRAYYSTFIFAIVPLVIGAGHQLPDLFAFIGYPSEAAKNMPMFTHSVPICIVWYMYFIIGLQIHAVQMYLQYSLVAIWAPLSLMQKKQLLKKDE